MTALEISFAGCTVRRGGMTWAQQDIYGFIYGGHGQRGEYRVRQDSPDLHGVVDPGVNETPASCVHALQTLVRQHEALRTTFVPGVDGFSLQHVHGDGTIPVHLCQTDGGEPDDVLTVIIDRLTTRAIDVTREFPLRVGLVMEADAVRRIVLVISHMVVDGWGLENLLRQARVVVTAPDLLQERMSPGFHQLDQWMWEQSPSGQLRARRALDYRRRLLTTDNGSDAGAAPRRSIRKLRRGALSLGATLSSAVLGIARSMSASVSALLLSSCARAVSQVLGVNTLTVLVHCANRYGPPRTDSVTRLKGMSVIRYEVASGGIENDIRQVWPALLTAYQHAQFPPNADAELVRPSAHPLSMEFNDHRPIADAAAGAAAGMADLTLYSASDVTLVDADRSVDGPHVGFAIDPSNKVQGLSMKLESNILADDEIVAALITAKETVRELAECR